MDYSRAKQCNNSNGGNNEFYLMPFVKYTRSEITLVGNLLTVFPYNIIYDLKGHSIPFKEDVEEDKGGVVFSQSSGCKINKISINDDFKKVAQQDYRIITKDNNGNYRMLGLFTGLKGKYSKETGAERSDFNGFDFIFETKEENTAPFLTDLSFFNVMPIEGLSIQDGSNNLIEDGNNNNIVN